MTPPLFVLDSSVGVKWFRDESGSETARELYFRLLRREIHIVVPAHFVHEVLAVVKRDMGTSAIVEAWSHMRGAGITIAPLTEDIVTEAAAQCDALGCSFYDALAPACAALLGGTLASADKRVHGEYPDVLIVA